MTTARRRIGDFYSPAWELFPAGLLAALLGVCLKVAAARAAAADEALAPAGPDSDLFFFSVIGILFYIASSFGGCLAVRTDDPVRDVNWFLVRFDPARVMTDPAAKERYLGTVVRMIFLVKTAVLAALLGAQIWLCFPRS